MRRLRRELSGSDRKTLRLLIDQATEVLKNPLVAGKAMRRYTGATDGVVQFAAWHFEDAVRILTYPRAKPPKEPKGTSGATEPVAPTRSPKPASKPKALLVLEAGKLRTVVRKSGAWCWTDMPAQLEASEPVAFRMTFEHLAHISDNWNAAFAPGHRSKFRLSTADRLMEFVEGEDGLEVLRLSRVTVEPAKAKRSEVWAHPQGEGVGFDAAQLADTLDLLLATTRHASKELARRSDLGASYPTARRQDFASIHIDDGFAFVLLRSCWAKVDAPGLRGLRLSIGRGDAKGLSRALRVMMRSRRTKFAQEHGLQTHPPRWSQFDGLHVIGTGDVGFAFKPSSEAMPKVDVTDCAVRAQTQIDLLGEHRHLLAHDLVVDNLELGLGLVCQGDRFGLASTGALGNGWNALSLLDERGGFFPDPNFVGPNSEGAVNGRDFLSVLDALFGGEIQAELCTLRSNLVLRLTRTIGDINFEGHLWCIQPADFSKAFRPRDVLGVPGEVIPLDAPSDHFLRVDAKVRTAG